MPYPDGPDLGESKYFAGDVIAAKYRLTSVLGEGGMGAVWLARNLTLDVDVAVKLIRRDVSTPEASQRLLQEARAAARLGHPSIVRVFDFGETEYKDPFIVMEVLRGESLGDVLDRKGRLPPVNAVQTLLPVASALAAAHGKGIVHRDLKPDNIVLVTDDTGAVIPKVVDFGIAKLREDDVSRDVTQVGAVLGSPDYMSPEQARGRGDVDERSDVWALAVVLYETVVGARPFDGANYNALLTAIVEQRPRSTTELGVGDPELWGILERGLSKDRAARWQTMREFGRALADWLLAQGIDTDVAGTSLSLHWVAESARRPLSDAPPASESLRMVMPLAPRVPSISGERPSLSYLDALEAGAEGGRASGTPAPPSARSLPVPSGPVSGTRKSYLPVVAIAAAAALVAGLAFGGWRALRGTSAEATSATSALSPVAAPSAQPAPAPAAPAPPAAASAAASAAPSDAPAAPAAAPSSAPRTSGSEPRPAAKAKAAAPKPSAPKPAAAKPGPAAEMPVPDAPNF